MEVPKIGKFTWGQYRNRQIRWGGRSIFFNGDLPPYEHNPQSGTVVPLPEPLLECRNVWLALEDEVREQEQLWTDWVAVKAFTHFATTATNDLERVGRKKAVWWEDQALRKFDHIELCSKQQNWLAVFHADFFFYFHHHSGYDSTTYYWCPCCWHLNWIPKEATVTDW